MTTDALETPRHEFWVRFALAWLAFLLLAVSLELTYEWDGSLVRVGLAVLGVSPLILTTAVVAFYRRRLLRPDWPTWRMVALHMLIGVVFALVNGCLIWLVTELPFAPESMPELSRAQRFGLASINAGFIYVVFLGALMWSESMTRYQESRALVAREAVLRAQAEAKAIRAQFNPHFVFNTLHSLMLLVRSDPSTAERAIEDVATLIRYASILQRDDVDRVPLAKEVEVARRYLALEELRLAERLRVVWDVPNGVGKMAIPAFSLQTLVENAVKHGLEPTPRGGTIEVVVRLERDVLAVEVRDDGVGSASLDRAPEGRGLWLLGRRLEVLYGDRASLEWSNGRGSGFSVVFTLPAEPAPDDGALGAIPEMGTPGLADGGGSGLRPAAAR